MVDIKIKQSEGKRSAGEAGWHVSRYNLTIPNPDGEGVLIANTYRGKCSVFTPMECYLLSVLEELDEDHPIIQRFFKCGVITRIDEYAMLEARGRVSSCGQHTVLMTICPTMSCNFDCTYCFENHFASRMSEQVQDDVVALAGRLLEAAKAERLSITWFGGEPLLATDIIASLSERLKSVAAEHGAEYHADIITNGYLLSQETADLLERASVEKAQITLDGLGPKHNATRRLAGGGPTFDRIVENLRTVKLPFTVRIRHNLHVDNLQERKPLEDFVKKLSRESGNELLYYPAVVQDSEVSDRRDSRVEVLCDSSAVDIDVFRDTIFRDTKRNKKIRAHYCGANMLYSVGVDDRGNLQKCWEDVDKPERSFGRVSVWDPFMPFRTADYPDRLTCYLNTAPPLDDPECRECVWLPICLGGCPSRRLHSRKACITYKNEPEKYVLALYRRKTSES